MDLLETHTLRDGRRATLRAASAKDAEHVVSLDRAIVQAGQGIVLDPGQVRGLDDARRHIDGFYRDVSAGSASILLVAEIESAAPPIAASAELRQLAPALCSHVGVLSVGVHPLYQRLGLGRALMQTLIAHAKAFGLTRLELYVRNDNARAMALYRSLGFALEGTRARFVRKPDGGYVDDHIFALFL
jgi:putative acetyltransferase